MSSTDSSTLTMSRTQAVVPHRYTELILYAVIFFFLVGTVFALNYVLSTQSQHDANQIFCATRQQKSWQKARKSLEKGQLNLYSMQPFEVQFLEFSSAIQTFQEITVAFRQGGSLSLDGRELNILPVQDPRSLRALDSLQSIWSTGEKHLLELASQFPLNGKAIDTALVNTAFDYAVVYDDAIFNAIQAFIVSLGELTSERINRLQLLQVISLVAGFLVFIFMVVRVTLSLRKQDRIIADNTHEIISQRDTIAKEKELVEKLLLDLRNTQAQLIQSEKMASLGQMVAGLAHEVNTPLGFVKNNFQVIERNQAIISQALNDYAKLGETLESGDIDHLEAQLHQAKSSLEKVRSFDLVAKSQKLISSSLVGLQRIQELITNLKNFSRLDETSVQNTNINEGIDSALMIAENIIKHKADVIRQYGEHVTAECYPAQLNQVFLNLITNAAQAIADGKRGTITITTYTENHHVVVKLADNGKGIAPEHLKKIFEPFFTTKPIGQGTGLGLSIAYKIIEKHHGTIQVKSELGKGTEFEIRIPQKLHRANTDKVVFLT